MSFWRRSCFGILSWFVIGAWLGVSSSQAAERTDILIADFEGETYGDWRTTGEAFGPGPARGTLPNQMHVEGFLGKGLVNSFFQGDKTTGTLTSPPVKIERKFINFLIGGGKHEETAVRLIVDDKVVRSSTGPNDQPGGAERLDWQSWDVTDLNGQTGVLQVVDRQTGGWGHVNVDHIVQSDRSRQALPQRREIKIVHDQLHLPVKNGATKRRVKMLVEERIVREFEIELADEPTSADFWVTCDMRPFHQKTLVIETQLPADSQTLKQIVAGSLPGGPEGEYREELRPLFHFTARRGWLNDPNGLVWLNGKFHLFFQHNPYGKEWGNMHWGHAVSSDLMHWREQPIALYPQRFGDWCFSGSAVVDKANTAGFKTGNNDVLVAAYTSTGRGECIVFSQDEGKTWTEFAENPVVKHNGRDPKLLWHEPTRRWVMAVYDEPPGRERRISFYISPNLKAWEFTSDIAGFYECPDLFELPVIGSPQQTKWVLYGADGKYLLGSFNGREFQPEPGGKQQLWHGNFYAAQTFSDTADGRRIQIGWANGVTFPKMPFGQQMTVPCELTLRTTPAGVRMFGQPVSELSRVREASKFNRHLETGAADIEVDWEIGTAQQSGLEIRGERLLYDAVAQQLVFRGVKVPFVPVGGHVRLRVLVDRGSVEIFANEGAIAMSVGVHFAANKTELTFFQDANTAKLVKLVGRNLTTTWNRD